MTTCCKQSLSRFLVALT